MGYLAKKALWIFLFLGLHLVSSVTMTENYPNKLGTSQLAVGGVDRLATALGGRLFKGCGKILFSDDQENPNTNYIYEHLALRFAQDGEFVYTILLNRDDDGAIFPDSSLKDPFFKNDANLSKYRSNCVLILMTLSNIYPGLPELMFRLLTPTHFEISRKNEDHYILISPEGAGRELLFSPSFGAKLKYKILLPLPEADKPFSLTMKTVCFFCGSGRAEYKSLEINELLENPEGATIHDIFPDYTKNFNGSELIAAVSTRTIQRILLEKDSNGEYKGKRGLYYIVIDNLRERFGFKLKIIPSLGNGGAGLQLANGTWFGSVGNILDGSAHIGMVTAQTVQRNAVVGFAFTLQYEWITFTTGQPHLKHSWKMMFKPFDSVMWLAVVVSTTGVLLALVSMRNFIDSGWKLGDIVEYIIATALGQSYKNPSHESILLLCSVWLFFGLIISTAYRSKLFEFLTLPESTIIPKTFEELAESKDFKWGLMYLAGAAYAVFASSAESTYAKIFQQMELIPDSYDCFSKGTLENYACISWQSFSEYTCHRNFTTKSGKKLLVEAPARTFFVPCGFILEKRAIFKENFDNFIKWSHDTGIMDKWEEMDWAHVRQMRFAWEKEANVTSATVAEDEEGVRTLEIVDFIGVLSLLVVFLIFAVIIFIAEISLVASKRLFWKVKRLVSRLGKY